MPTPRLCPTRPASRASAYPAGTASTSVMPTTAMPMIAVFFSHVVYGVLWKRKRTFSQVGPCLNQYGVAVES